jgi:hypothetical protein
MLAEYSIVKCGIWLFHSQLLFLAPDEMAADRNVGAIIGLDCVSLACLDRTDDGTERGCGEMINMLNGSDQTP